MPKKTIEQKQTISKRNDTDIWTEIRKMYESNARPTVEKIIEVLQNEFDLDKFPSESTIRRRAKKEEWKRKEEKKSDAIARGYDDNLWKCIRAVFEGNPKITYLKLKEIVTRELDCEEFPSQTAVRAKAKAEDWRGVEGFLGLDDNGLKELIGIVIDEASSNISKLTKNPDFVEYQRLKMVGDACIEDAKEVSTDVFARIKKLLAVNVKKKKNLMDVIIESRKEMDMITKVDSLIGNKLLEYHSLFTSMDFMEECPPEYYLWLKQNQRETMKLSRTINDLALNRRENIKFNLSLYGVELGDLRVEDDSNKIIDLNDDSDFIKQKEVLVEQRRLIMERKMKIENGHYQEIVNEDMRKASEEIDDEFMDVEGSDDPIDD